MWFSGSRSGLGSNSRFVNILLTNNSIRQTQIKDTRNPPIISVLPDNLVKQISANLPPHHPGFNILRGSFPLEIGEQDWGKRGTEDNDLFKPTRLPRWDTPWSSHTAKFSPKEVEQVLNFIATIDICSDIESLNVSNVLLDIPLREFDSRNKLTPRAIPLVYARAAELFWMGCPGVLDRDLAKSQHFNHLAADLGYHESSFRLGMQYFFDPGRVAHDKFFPMAVNLMRAAELGNHAEAQFTLGWLTTRNDLIPDTLDWLRLHEKQHQHWLQSAAMQGHSRAMLHLAQLYKRDFPNYRVEQRTDILFSGEFDFRSRSSYPMYVKWIERAVANGCPEACHEFGLTLFSSEIIERDLEIAILLLAQSASSYFWPSWVVLGALYARGFIPPHITKKIEGASSYIVPFFLDGIDDESKDQYAIAEIFSQNPEIPEIRDVYNPIVAFGSYYDSQTVKNTKIEDAEDAAATSDSSWREILPLGTDHLTTGPYVPDMKRAAAYFRGAAIVGDLDAGYIWLKYIKKISK